MLLEQGEYENTEEQIGSRNIDFNSITYNKNNSYGKTRFNTRQRTPN